MSMLPNAFAELARKEKWDTRTCAILAATCWGVPMKGVESLTGAAREIADLLQDKATEPSSDEIAEVVSQLRSAGDKHRRRNGEAKEGDFSEWTEARLKVKR